MRFEEELQCLDLDTSVLLIRHAKHEYWKEADEHTACCSTGEEYLEGALPASGFRERHGFRVVR
jgi:hypothetical protein